MRFGLSLNLVISHCSALNVNKQCGNRGKGAGGKRVGVTKVKVQNTPRSRLRSHQGQVQGHTKVFYTLCKMCV